MDTYIVPNRTINRIISNIYFKRELREILEKKGIRLVRDDEREEFGRRLFEMNIRALRARFGKELEKEIENLSYKYVFLLPDTDIQALKSLRCFICQCAEGDIPDSDLYKTLKLVHDQLMLQIIVNLPEYQDAIWG